MTQATIVLANDGFGRSDAGLVYCGLFIQLDELQFPDARWTDFAVVVLAWWCRALSRLLAGERSAIEVRFMEGPYFVEVGPTSGHFIHLELIESGLNRRVLRRAEVPYDALVDSLLLAAARVLAECKARDWRDGDTDELADAMGALKQERLRTIN